MDQMDRLRVLLRKAIERNDRVAIANLQAQIRKLNAQWTEAELRAAWGDR